MAVRLCVVVVFAALLVAGAGGQSDCTQAYNYLSGCLAYVTGTEPTPSAACCSGISFLNTNNADCLCQIVTQYSNSTTPGVNATQAYALPTKCNIVIDTAKCPTLALPPGTAIPPTPPLLSPPGGSPGGTGGPAASAGSAASATSASGATTWMAVLAATLGATHLLWNALSAT